MDNAKSKRAAALKFDPESDSAPIMTAFGEGFVAEKIIEKAEKSGVPITQDAELLSTLARMSIGDEIPPELYEVVAKVLIFVSDIDRSYGKRIRSSIDNKYN